MMPRFLTVPFPSDGRPEHHSALPLLTEIIFTKKIIMSVSASRYRARRLAIMIDASGIDVDPSCVNCLRAHRRCVAASFSRRCSECVARSSSCSLSSTQAILNSGVCVEREVALRLEVAQLLARLRACLAELDSIDRSRAAGSHTLGPSQGS